MLDILPIDKIRDEDGSIVGTDIVNLAKLDRLGFPVAKGVAVCPPEFKLRTILKQYNLKDREIFEASLTIIKKEIAQIPPPVEFDKMLSGKKIDIHKLWLSLLEIWINEIRKKIWKDGLGSGVTLGLSTQTVFFIKKTLCSGKSFFDPVEQKVILEIDQGVTGDGLREKLEEVVLKGDKKLFIPQIYYWIVDGKGADTVKIVRVKPYTPVFNPRETNPLDSLIKEKKLQPEILSVLKSTVKVFVDLSENNIINTEADGVLICGEKLTSFDSKVFKLVESAQTYPGGSVIFKLSDISDKFGGVRGSLRLIHQKKLLEEDIEAFLFARNKKGLLNVSIAIPFVRSSIEFLTLKRELASKGVSRKGSLKLWMELGVPENVINIEEYLVAGLDGVIINLDELAAFLGGFDPTEPETTFYGKGVSALEKFLEDALRVLHKSGLPTIFSGSLSTHDDILQLVLDKGIWGLAVNPANSLSLHEHIRFLEKRHLRSN